MSDISTKSKKYPPPFSMRFTDDERKALETAAAGRPLATSITVMLCGGNSFFSTASFLSGE